MTKAKKQAPVKRDYSHPCCPDFQVEKTPTGSVITTHTLGCKSVKVK